MKIDAMKIAEIYLLFGDETDSVCVHANPHKGFDPKPLFEWDYGEWISEEDEEIALATDTAWELSWGFPEHNEYHCYCAATLDRLVEWLANQQKYVRVHPPQPSARAVAQAVLRTDADAPTSGVRREQLLSAMASAIEAERYRVWEGAVGQEMLAEFKAFDAEREASEKVVRFPSRRDRSAS